MRATFGDFSGETDGGNGPCLVQFEHARGTSQSAIQVYNLFGEQGDLPDVVHCETIASRSVLHDWKLAVHRHARLHQVLLIARGGGEATLDGRVHPLKPMHMVNVPVGVVHGFSFVPATQGWVSPSPPKCWMKPCWRRKACGRAVACGRGARDAEIRALMQQIFAEHAGRRFGRAHVLRALSAALIGLVARELAGESAASGAPNSNWSAASRPCSMSNICSAGAWRTMPGRCRSRRRISTA